MRKRIIIILAFVLLIAVHASAQQVRVKGNRTPLRDEPTTTSTVLAFYQMGTRLDVIDLANGWYKVRDPQTRAEGYIMATLVELLPGPTPTPRVPVRPGAIAPPHETNPNRWTDRGYVVLNGVYQSGMPAFAEAFTYTEYVEKTTITTDYPTKKGPAFDGGGAVKVWRNLAVGVSVSLARRSTEGSVSGAIPHPFYFDKARSISGSAAIERSENAVHVQALWVIPAGQRFLIAVGAGPSFFSVKQSLVQSLSFSQSYPYDTAMFTSATVSQPSGSAVGVGGSVDVGYYFTRNVGLGGMVRYARATVPLPTHDSTVEVDAGGFEAGLGLRVRLPQGKPKKAPAKPPIPAKPVKRQGVSRHRRGDPPGRGASPGEGVSAALPARWLVNDAPRCAPTETRFDPPI